MDVENIYVGKILVVDLNSGACDEEDLDEGLIEEHIGGAALNPNVWLIQTGDGTAEGIPGWGNNELQWYTDEPANVALDGKGEEPVASAIERQPALPGIRHVELVLDLRPVEPKGRRLGLLCRDLGEGALRRHLELDRGAVVGVEDSAAGILSLRLAGYAGVGLAGGNIEESGLRPLCAEYADSLDATMEIIDAWG